MRLEDDFPYCLYLGGPQARLRSLARALGQKGWLRRAYPARGRDLWTGREIPVVALEVKAYGFLPRVRQWLGTLPAEVACYNCDLDIAAVLSLFPPALALRLVYGWRPKTGACSTSPPWRTPSPWSFRRRPWPP